MDLPRQAAELPAGGGAAASAAERRGRFRRAPVRLPLCGRVFVKKGLRPFAILYSLQPVAVSDQGSVPPISNFFSPETLATVGYGEMYPATTRGHVVSSVEIMIGATVTAIVKGLLFVRFSRPRA